MNEKLGTTVVLEIWRDWETEERPKLVKIENVYALKHRGSSRNIWLGNPNEVHVVMFTNTDRYIVQNFGSTDEFKELIIETHNEPEESEEDDEVS